MKTATRRSRILSSISRMSVITLAADDSVLVMLDKIDRRGSVIFDSAFMTLLRIIWSKPVPSLHIGLDLNRVALADSLFAEMLIRAEIKKITRSLFSALILNLIKDIFLPKQASLAIT